MGAIKDLAVELELYWQEHENSEQIAYTRYLPDGRLADISVKHDGSAVLSIAAKSFGEYPTIIEALFAAGQIVRDAVAKVWAA